MLRKNGKSDLKGGEKENENENMVNSWLTHGIHYYYRQLI